MTGPTIRTSYGTRRADGPAGNAPKPQFTAPAPVLPPADVVFRYEELAPDIAVEARAVAERIKARIKNSVIETGRDLAAMKAALPHGCFLPWVKSEFGMTERTATNYMQAAAFVAGKSETVSDLPPTALYALSSPSAPPAVVQEIIAEVEAGKPIEPAAIRERIAEAATLQRKAALIKSAEQIQKDRGDNKRRRETERKRLEKEEEERLAAEKLRTERAEAVARFLVNHLGGEATQELAKMMDRTDWHRVNKVLNPVGHGVMNLTPAEELERRFKGEMP